MPRIYAFNWWESLWEFGKLHHRNHAIWSVQEYEIKWMMKVRIPKGRWWENMVSMNAFNIFSLQSFHLQDSHLLSFRFFPRLLRKWIYKHSRFRVLYLKQVEFCFRPQDISTNICNYGYVCSIRLNSISVFWRNFISNAVFLNCLHFFHLFNLIYFTNVNLYLAFGSEQSEEVHLRRTK